VPSTATCFPLGDRAVAAIQSFFPGPGMRSLRSVARNLAPGVTWTRYHSVADGIAGGCGFGLAPRTNVRSSTAADTVTNLSVPNARTVSSRLPVRVSPSTAVREPGTFAKLSPPGKAR
jgi:hypothetical protein